MINILLIVFLVLFTMKLIISFLHYQNSKARFSNEMNSSNIVVTAIQSIETFKKEYNEHYNNIVEYNQRLREQNKILTEKLNVGKKIKSE